MQNILRKSLGLEEETKLETNAVVYEELYGNAVPSSSQSESGIVNGVADSSAYSNSSYGADPNGQYYVQ